MNDITTKETSAALIAAGMPVPDVKVGQVWYNNLGFASVVIREMDSNFIAASFLDDEVGNDFSERQIKSFCLPAFTAVDILRELGSTFFLELSECEKIWTICKYYHDTSIDTISEHANPAEAAALAFIALKNA
jgi:hypothetical protein